MWGRRRLLRFPLFAALLGLLLAAPTAAAPALPHLRGMRELKQWFNANQGHPRLMLLLSPT